MEFALNLHFIEGAGGLVRLRTLIALFLMIGTLTANAGIPTGYYDATSGKSGQALATALHEIIDGHTRYPYTSSGTDTWDLLAAACEYPGNANYVLTIYKNEPKPKSDHNQGTGWNREHTWAKSLGFPEDVACNYPYTDAHHLMAADWDYNSARSNKPFDNCTSGCTEYPAVNGSSSNWTNATTWEPWDDVKGDIARAMFYMAVRYNGGTHGGTGCAEPDLRLTSDRALIQQFSTNQSVGYMGILSTLLTWHSQDPVDGYEQAHNDIVYGFQGNRNPFIDHPEWVQSIFGGGDGSGGTTGGGGGGGGGGTGAIWINELHYDNASTDVAEGVEVAGPAGTSLSGWQLVAYNGSGGASYLTVNLSGTLANQSNGFGTAFFAMSGLQNGSPDGIALVNASGTAVEFISYEGSFTATNGPANGMTASDIGVAEAGAVSGQSLQLGGSGSNRAAFQWQAERTATAGAVNGGQSFTGTSASWTVLNLNTFESSLGGYSDGGADCARGAYSGYAHGGSYSVQLRDDTGATASLYTTSSYNYTSYSQLRISFWFKANSMENGEDFYIEFYQNGSWVVIDQWIAGTDFTNGSFVNAQVVLDSPTYNFASSRFRIRCDASDDTDTIYVDDLEVAGL